MRARALVAGAAVHPGPQAGGPPIEDTEGRALSLRQPLRREDGADVAAEAYDKSLPGAGPEVILHRGLMSERKRSQSKPTPSRKGSSFGVSAEAEEDFPEDFISLAQAGMVNGGQPKVPHATFMTMFSTVPQSFIPVDVGVRWSTSACATRHICGRPTWTT
jgi:hypothetical protein